MVPVDLTSRLTALCLAGLAITMAARLRPGSPKAFLLLLYFVIYGSIQLLSAFGIGVAESSMTQLLLLAMHMAFLFVYINSLTRSPKDRELGGGDGLVRIYVLMLFLSIFAVILQY